jgi:methylthioribose-1-phosphate isomerase
MIVQAVTWIGGVDGYLELVDQRRLPGEFVKLECRDAEQLHHAIRALAVRGAPAIGVAAAYGVVLGLQRLGEDDTVAEARNELTDTCEYLAGSRPTAVNLFWALDRVKCKVETTSDRVTLGELREAALSEANAIFAEDVDMCRRIGENGQRFIEDGVGVLTHCNAGALAAAGQGTALSVLFEAHRQGKKFHVYADETRPLLQGARLTAWELQQAGIGVTVICDNMAGWLMKQGKVGMVITGADRIAANGDAANKIGTYSLSVLAKKHGIPFYIAAPSSTFDLSIADGSEIPIELRAGEEVVRPCGAELAIAPDGVDVWNPAFDVTDARDITAIITERGVIEGPNAERVAEHLQAGA